MAYKPKEFVVGYSENFQEMVDSKDFRIAENHNSSTVCSF